MLDVASVKGEGEKVKLAECAYARVRGGVKNMFTRVAKTSLDFVLCSAFLLENPHFLRDTLREGSLLLNFIVEILSVRNEIATFASIRCQIGVKYHIV